MRTSSLLNMSLEDLKKFASDELGLDVAGIDDRTLILQQVLSQDESYGRSG